MWGPPSGRPMWAPHSRRTDVGSTFRWTLLADTCDIPDVSGWRRPIRALIARETDREVGRTGVPGDPHEHPLIRFKRRFAAPRVSTCLVPALAFAQGPYPGLSPNVARFAHQLHASTHLSRSKQTPQRSRQACDVSVQNATKHVTSGCACNYRRTAMCAGQLTRCNPQA